MFIGRTAELKKLNTLYDTDQFEMAVIYGRRRIGKTALIHEFVKAKPAIYFTALEMPAIENLGYLSQNVYAAATIDDVSYIEESEYLYYSTDSSGHTPIYPDYQSVFDAVYQKSKNHRLVLVIDEYPYLAASYPPISSILQVFIDSKFKNSKLFLILCGSSMSFMENQVLGSKSPLYGRRTTQMKLRPFSFFESRKFIREFKNEDAALLYGVTGGIPFYLDLIKKDKTAEENIQSLFLDPSGYLFEEPANLLKQEVREPAKYNAIIKAIATGSSRMSEIASKAQLPTSAVSLYLDNLISLGIIQKEMPVYSDSNRRTIYAFQDHMFRFWFRFIPPLITAIQNNMTDLAYRQIKQYFPTYMASVFEDICRQWIWEENKKGELPFEITTVGRWWGNDPNQHKQAEIDVIAHDTSMNTIFGECKWRNEQTGVEVIKKLKERAMIIPNVQEKKYYLFSKSGFTSGSRQAAKEDTSICLIPFRSMCEPLSADPPQSFYVIASRSG